MNRLAIPSILAATVLVAGIFALMPVDKASTVHTAIQAAVRDSNTVTDTSLTVGQRLVLLDLAGTGSTSDVEVTWRFADGDCRVETIGGTIQPPGVSGGAGTLVGSLILQDDAAFGGNPPHADVNDSNGIFLEAVVGTCDMTHAAGAFVTVTTIGAP